MKTEKKTPVNTTAFKHVKEQARAVWFKFYAEQVGYTAPNNPDMSAAPTLGSTEYLAQVDALKHFFEALTACDHPGYSFHGIIHTLDNLKSEDFWKPSTEKPHAHLLIMSEYFDANGKRCPKCLSTFLNYLKQFGLEYRPDVDTQLLLNHGAEKINMQQNRHINAIVYHTHETVQAMQDGKHKYDRSECYTNIPADVLESYYQTYEALTSQGQKGAIIMYEEHAMSIGQATILGKYGYDFDTWWFNKVPGEYRTIANYKRCEKAYAHGMQLAIDAPGSRKHIRCAIFINGKPDTGKTYTSCAALEELGLKVYEVDSGKTGKFDDLTPLHRGICISDTSIPDLMAITDNRKVSAYRRNSNNPVFCGEYVIITYNGTLDQYLDKFYSDLVANPDTRKAIHSRFFECELVDGSLCLRRPSLRGTNDDIKARTTLFMSFFSAFNACISRYNPDDSDKLDYFYTLTNGQFDKDMYHPNVNVPEYDRRFCIKCPYYSDSDEHCEKAGTEKCVNPTTRH